MLALGFQLQNPSGRVPGRVKVVWGGGGGGGICVGFFLFCVFPLWKWGTVCFPTPQGGHQQAQDLPTVCSCWGTFSPERCHLAFLVATLHCESCCQENECFLQAVCSLLENRCLGVLVWVWFFVLFGVFFATWEFAW